MQNCRSCKLLEMVRGFLGRDRTIGELRQAYRELEAKHKAQGEQDRREVKTVK